MKQARTSHLSVFFCSLLHRPDSLFVSLGPRKRFEHMLVTFKDSAIVQNVC